MTTTRTLTPMAGEPRIHERILAVRLDVERPVKTGDLIRRPQAQLMNFSLLPAVANIQDGAGRLAEKDLLPRTLAAKAQTRPKTLCQWRHAPARRERRASGKGWVASQHRLPPGVLEHPLTTVLRDAGRVGIAEQVQVTAMGLTQQAGGFPGVRTARFAEDAA